MRYPNKIESMIKRTVPPTAAAMMMVVGDFERELADSASSAAIVAFGGEGVMMIGEVGGRIVRMSSFAVGSQLRWEMENVERS